VPWVPFGFDEIALHQVCFAEVQLVCYLTVTAVGPMHAPSILECDAAEQVFSVLISSAYRRNSLTRMNLAECRTAILSALRRRTKHGFPIQLELSRPMLK